MDTSATSMFATVNNIVAFGSHAVIVIIGIIGMVTVVYKFWTGGFHFIKVAKKISKFVDRVDCVVDDFWPEILGGMEKAGYVATGASARWASAQAKILKSQSPIEITPTGRQIIDEIGFEKIYNDNVAVFQKFLKEKLAGTSVLTEYDVEQASLKVVADLFDKSDPLIKSAESYTFNHPQMPISQLQALLGIFIRDTIIKDPKMRQSFGLAAPEIKP